MDPPPSYLAVSSAQLEYQSQPCRDLQNSDIQIEVQPARSVIPKAAFNSPGTTTIKIRENLWAQATEKLTEKEKLNLERPKTGTASIIEDVLSEVKANEERVVKALIKIKTRRGEVPLQQYFSKLVTWINKFKEAGDVLVQYDPGHAALPWAGIRFLLTIAVNDHEIFRDMAEGVELISGMVTQYAIIESLYLLEDSAVRSQLIDGIVKLYVAILQYLLTAKSYYKKRGIQRSIESVVKTTHSVVEAPLAQILTEHARIQEISKIMDAESKRGSDRKLSTLQETVESMLQDVTYLRKSSVDMLRKLEPIEGFITEISGLHKETRDQRKREERTEALHWLSRVPFEAHHAKSREGLVKDSGLWLMERHCYIDWKDSRSSSALWLHGIVGCGKTKLMSVVIQRLLDEHKANPKAPNIAYFYCNGSEQQRTKPEEILRTIARQLAWAGRDVPLREPFMNFYAQQKQKADEGQTEPVKLDCKDFTTLIIQLLEECPAILIIDALDECRDRPILLKGLTRILQSKTKVKVFLSGRDEVSRELPKAEFSSYIHINSTDTQVDIAHYIHSKLEAAISDKRLLNGRVEAELKNKIIEVINRGADGMFLWVKLQLQNLCDKRIKIEKDVRKELGRLSPGIEELYQNIFQQLEESAEGSRSGAEAVLKWLLCARRPLSLNALIEAVSSVEDNRLYLLAKEEVLLICCNLVVADDETDTFRFAHVSVQEFLEKKGPYKSSQLHSFAAQRCIEEFIEPRASLHNKELSSSDYSKSFHAYAVAHWDYHFACVDVKDRTGELSKNIEEFLLDEEHFAVFNSEGLISAERREYDEYPHLSLSLLSNKPTSIFAACRFGLKNVLEELEEEQINWNRTNIQNNVPLHLAAGFGHEDIVKFLLDHDGVEADKKGEYDETPLNWTALNNIPNITELLLDKYDVNVNAKDVI